MVSLSMDAFEQIGGIIGLCLSGSGFALGAALTDKYIWPRFRFFCLYALDFLCFQMGIQNIIYSYESTRKGALAGILVALAWIASILCYALSFNEKHIFLMYWGIEHFLRKLMNAWIDYLAADGPPGAERLARSKWKTVTFAYWSTTFIIVYWAFTKSIFLWTFKYICSPLICGVLALWIVVRQESKHQSTATKDKLLVILGRTLYNWGTCNGWILDTLELLELHTFVRLPDYVARQIARLQRKWYARNHVPLYKYTPLSKNLNEIRLLELEDGTCFAGIIRARMIHAPINSTLKYEALSYRWGEPQFSEEIIVDGRRLAVTKSAYDLLLARRSYWRSRLVWCDAICINQNDTEEKTHQVRMMKQIYQNAYRVIVWAGADWTAYLAAPMMMEVFAASIQFQGTGMDFYKFFYKDRDSPRWAAVIEMFKNPYLSRIWVVQEVSAGKLVYLYHGGIYIPWEMFTYVMVECFQEHRRPLLEPKATTTWEPLGKTMENALVMASLRPADFDQHYSTDFGPTGLDARFRFRNLLFTCAMFEATNPVDKVFALVGLATDGDHELLQPNYAKSTEQVYSDAAQYLFQCGENPNPVLALAGIGYERRLQDLPSWVPDFSSPRPNFPLTNVSSQSAPYRASGQNLFCDARITEDKKAIRQQGMIVDTILDTSDDLSCVFATPKDKGLQATIGPKSIQAIKLRLDYVNAASQIAQKYKAWWQDESSFNSTFCRTLIGDTFDRTRIAEGRASFDSVLRAYSLWVRRVYILGNLDSLEDGKNLPQEQQEELGTPFSEDQALVTSFGTAFMEAAYGRRFCITEGGEMALVPPYSRKGDVISIFYGAQTPFVLRAKDRDSFELVGEAYVHGAMDGEMWEAEEMEPILIV